MSVSLYKLYTSRVVLRACSDVVWLPDSRCSGLEQHRTEQLWEARSVKRVGFVVQFSEHLFRRSVNQSAVEQHLITARLPPPSEKTLRYLYRTKGSFRPVLPSRERGEVLPTLAAPPGSQPAAARGLRLPPTPTPAAAAPPSQSALIVLPRRPPSSSASPTRLSPNRSSLGSGPIRYQPRLPSSLW